jgi:hypothetical protein
MMKSPNNRPLQETPDAFDGVGVDFTPDVFVLGVVDGLMAGVMVSNASIGRPFISKDSYRFRGNVLQGDFMQSFPGSVSGNLEYDFPIPLNNSDNKCLVTFVASPLPFGFPTYKGFVHFDNTAKKHLSFSVSGLVHSGPDSVTEIPSCFVGDIQFSFKLVGRDAFLRLNHGVDSQKPLPQWQMSVLKHAVNCDRELVTA